MIDLLHGSWGEQAADAILRGDREAALLLIVPNVEAEDWNGDAERILDGLVNRAALPALTRRTPEELGRTHRWNRFVAETVADLTRDGQLSMAALAVFHVAQDVTPEEARSVVGEMSLGTHPQGVDLVEIPLAEVVVHRTRWTAEGGEEVLQEGEQYLFRHRDRIWADTPRSSDGREPMVASSSYMMRLAEVEQAWRIVDRAAGPASS